MQLQEGMELSEKVHEKDREIEIPGKVLFHNTCRFQRI